MSSDSIIENQGERFIDNKGGDQDKMYLSLNDSYIEKEPFETVIFQKEIKIWSLKHNCTRQCTNDLLTILNRHGHQEMPKDARTLLCTRRVVKTASLKNGNYIYFGIKQGIENILQVQDFNSTKINLICNVDGLPLFKSSAYQVWPILCQFGYFKPFVVGLYGGKIKPCASELLADFAEELKTFKQPEEILGKVFNISLFAITCDAPGRALLKGTVEHSGYYACERCNLTGFSVHGRIVYDKCQETVTNRNNADLKAGLYSQKDNDVRCHLHTRTPLFDVEDLDMIQDFALDYMHLVNLGVMRRMLYYYKGTYARIFNGRLSTPYLKEISRLLANLNGKLPSDFVRQTRSLEDVNRWKATELRTFLLYVGIVVLKDILNPQMYKHFLSLSLAIRMLCEENNVIRKTYLSHAQKLLEYFVSNAHEHFGETFCVYNVHCLLHITDDVEHFQSSLDEISCFQFENFLQQLKRLVRGKQNPLVELAKRLSEHKSDDPRKAKLITKIDVSKNACFMTKDFVVFVKNILPNDQLVCDIYKKNHLNNFFDSFIESKILNIYYIKNHNCSAIQTLNIHDLLRKCVCIPYKNNKVVISLLNNVHF